MLGVRFVEANNSNELQEGEHAGDRYTWWYGKNAAKNRCKAYRERAKREGVSLEEWMKANGRGWDTEALSANKTRKTVWMLPQIPQISRRLGRPEIGLERGLMAVLMDR